MKKYHLIAPLLAASALISACTPVEPAFNHFDALKVSVTDNLTSDESKTIESGDKTVKVGDSLVSFVPAIITDSDGSKKNGGQTQSKHVRFAMDTSKLPAGCNDAQFADSNDELVNGTKQCLKQITILADRTNRSDQMHELGSITPNGHNGAKLYEFDAIDTSVLRVMVSLSNGVYTSFNPVTGETTKSDKLDAAEAVHMTFSNGLTPAEKDSLSSLTPQYGKDSYVIKTAPAQPVKQADGTYLLRVPAEINLSEACAPDDLINGDKTTHYVTVMTDKIEPTYVGSTYRTTGGLCVTDFKTMATSNLGVLEVRAKSFGSETTLHIVAISPTESRVMDIDLTTGKVTGDERKPKNP